MRAARLLIALVAIASIAAALAALWSWPAAAPAATPTFISVREAYTPSEAYLLDRHGELLQVQRENYRVRRLPWVGLSALSPALKAAVIQAEDRRFAEHQGVDWRALIAAALDVAGGHPDRGASTISMQVAAMLDPALAPKHGHRTTSQKLRQVRAALALESAWTKDQILEAYLNLVGFRGELQGIHTAAQALFAKAPSGLDVDESWLLAALLPAPGARQQQVARRACALKRTLDVQATCDALELLATTALDGSAPIAKEADLAPHLARRLLDRAGQRAQTTIDAGAQKIVIAALTQQVMGLADRNVRDAAAVVVDNATGEVLAYVGSVDVSSRAAMVDGARAPRQAGSTLKPFLYGLALEKRYLTAASLLDDSPVQLQTGAGLYVPQDYEQEYRGLVSVRSALAGSLNVPAVRALVLIGGDAFLDRLHALGYATISGSADHYGYSLALGSAEVTLLEQVNAFRTLANGGMWSPLRFERDHAADRGTVSADAATADAASPRRVVSEQSAFIIGDILADRAGRAGTFGLANVLGTPFWSAVKTGTSKFMRDNWCVGYSSRYTVGVWVGNFDGAPMRDVSGVSGAAPAWLEIMSAIHEGARPARPEPPADLVSAHVRFAEKLEAPRDEWFIAGTQIADVRVAPQTVHAARLQSPAAGTIVALDPDIPADRQQVPFRSEPRDGALRYELDGVAIAAASRDYFWSPLPGRHQLRLVDGKGSALDEVMFTVRMP